MARALHEVPTIDLAAAEDELVAQVAAACSEWGFFQVVNHGVPPELVEEFRAQMVAVFALPDAAKGALRRSGENARGYFDDELTKQRRDWKQALDFGVPGSRDWRLPDGHAANGCLDGFNRLPDAATLPRFRPAMVAYFDALTALSERLAAVMAKGLGMPPSHFDELLHATHTSYLRLNTYPPCTEAGPPPPLGISPHRDAGFLTVLWQDPECHSLQVHRRGAPDGEWSTVVPTAGAFTINTGDMAQIWSNDRYHAPLHRVLTHPTKQRYSAPFFYNPGYTTSVAPLPSLGAPRFAPCLWGYFRAQRFAGDFADFGSEIQTDDYRVREPASAAPSAHVARQATFASAFHPDRPFSVEEYRPLLVMD